MLRNAHADGQLAYGLYGSLCGFLVAHANGVNIHSLGNLYVLVDSSRHVELHHCGQKQSVCHTMRNIENGAHRMCHAMNYTKTHIGECHAGNVLSNGHAIACFGILWLVDSGLQIACYHLDGFEFEHVAHFPSTLGDKTFDGMCESIHTSGGGEAAG